MLPNLSLQCDKLNDAFEKFVTAISDTIEKRAPLTRLSRKQAKLAKSLGLQKAFSLLSKERTQCFAAIS